MKRRTKRLIYAGLTILLVAYLVVAGVWSTQTASERLCRGVFIQVIDSAKQKFVTVDELKKELGRLPLTARRSFVESINTDSIECRLRVIDKIESVNVKRLTDGTIHIIVEPMRPVARVFDGDQSYYINKDGKSISAEARYHVDVPVIAGNFNDSLFTAKSLLPLLDYIGKSERWSKLVTMVKADSPRDVLIIPAIRGLVFNLGDTEGLPGKFARLERMMAEVLPSKGWSHYDTLSVKWAGQVVATRRQKAVRDTTLVVEEVKENDDMETMTVGDNVAAGQALPGRKAHGEKPVPGAASGAAKRMVKEGKAENVQKVEKEPKQAEKTDKMENKENKQDKKKKTT